MRVIVVLAILAAALLATILIRNERESSFDHRFEQAEKRIRELAADIEQDAEKDRLEDE